MSDNDSYNNSGAQDQDDGGDIEQQGYEDGLEEDNPSEDQGSDKDIDAQQQQDEIDDEDESQDDEQFQKGNAIIDQNQVNQHDEPNKLKITSPYMTKYQKARIIGVRAVQISKNAPIYVQIGDNMNTDPLSIAERELAEKKLPFIIRRYLPDGSYQHWKVSELKTFD